MPKSRQPGVWAGQTPQTDLNRRPAPLPDEADSTEKPSFHYSCLITLQVATPMATVETQPPAAASPHPAPTELIPCHLSAHLTPSVPKWDTYLLPSSRPPLPLGGLPVSRIILWGALPSGPLDSLNKLPKDSSACMASQGSMLGVHALALSTSTCLFHPFFQSRT